MKFDFSKTKLSDEIKKILSDADVVAAMDTQSDSEISSQVTAQVAIASKKFDTSKTGFKESMDALDAKLKKAEKDLADYLAKDTGDADKDELKAARLEVTTLKGQIDAITQERDDAVKQGSAAQEGLQTLEHKNIIRKSMQAHNSKHKDLAVLPETEEVVEMLAQKYVVPNKDGGYDIMKMDGNPLTTAEGLGTVDDWFDHLRQEKPGLFSTPKGSGAPGSQTPGGAGGKAITRSEFDALSHTEKAKVATTHQIVE